MNEYSGSKLYQTGVFSEFLARKEPVILVLGHSRELRFYVLPITGEWDKIVGDCYGHSGQVVCMPLRNLRSEAGIMSIMMGAVDECWHPLTYGIVTVGNADAAYIVPALPYWRALVEGEDE